MTLWTELGMAVVVVPFILAAIVVLFAAVFLTLSSFADIHCPACGKRFGDVFSLRKHVKKGEEKETLKAA